MVKEHNSFAYQGTKSISLDWSLVEDKGLVWKISLHLTFIKLSITGLTGDLVNTDSIFYEIRRKEKLIFSYKK